MTTVSALASASALRRRLREFGAGKWARQWRDLAAFRALVASRIVPPETHVTNVNKTDGVGSQIHQTIAVRAFSAAIGIPYAHTPIAEAAHTTSSGEIARWNELFPLGEGCTGAASLSLPLMSLANYVRTPSAWSRPHLLTNVEVHPYLARHPGAYERVRNDIRADYRGPASTGSRDGKVSVAIHIRRGDVGPRSPRYTSTQHIATRLAALRVTAERHGFTLAATVFSQGDPSHFADLEDVELRLDGDPAAAMQAMITAEVLVLAKSSFSYVAGYVSRGIVVYEQFERHPRLQGWHFNAEDIDFSALLSSAMTRQPEWSRPPLDALP